MLDQMRRDSLKKNIIKVLERLIHFYWETILGINILSKSEKFLLQAYVIFSHRTILVKFALRR